ncbi:MAG: nucleotide exchange factor GrpE [Polyangiaceae bacterium]|nr:nucleotide exchange factor GrpE [Polyangiaceae bacterium]
MTERTDIGYFRRLGLALLGRDAASHQEAVPRAAESDDTLRLGTRVAELKLEISERDQRIETMRAEYATLLADKQRIEAGAGEQRLVELLTKLAPTLSSLCATAAWFDQGKPVEPGDLVSLGRELEKRLARFGLERVGEVGQEVPFDVAVHQRMSGGSVAEGVEVLIEMPGYRLKDRVLLKAMVSRKEG